jgi:hypothetical protein
VLGRRPHSELVHVGLAERHETRGTQARDRGRVVGRNPTLENLGARGRRHVDRAEHVLDRNRNTGEWPERVAGGALLVDARRGRDGIRRDVEERVNPTVDGGDTVEVCLSGFDG